MCKPAMTQERAADLLSIAYVHAHAAADALEQFGDKAEAVEALRFAAAPMADAAGELR